MKKNKKKSITKYNLQKMKNILILLLSFLMFSFIVEPNDIDTAIRSGNTKVLFNRMNENVELVILDKDDIYSKVQAQKILQQFFEKNKPISFEILHKGGKEDTQYFIGTLKTKDKKFRVYYLLKTKQNKSLIYQFRIELDE